MNFWSFKFGFKKKIVRKYNFEQFNWRKKITQIRTKLLFYLWNDVSWFFELFSNWSWCFFFSLIALFVFFYHYNFSPIDSICHSHQAALEKRAANSNPNKCVKYKNIFKTPFPFILLIRKSSLTAEKWLSLIHIWRCRRSTLCRSRWSPYH